MTFRRRSKIPLHALWVVLLASMLAGCSVRQYALNQAADALAKSGNSFASDDDLALIRDAAPFSLKLLDSAPVAEVMVRDPV